MNNEDLVRQIKEGNRESIEQLFRNNRGLIVSVAAHYVSYEEMEDLIQEGFFGLIKAAELWEEEKGAAFSTYAIYWIKQSMIRYIENNGNMLRLPAYRRQRVQSYKKLFETFNKDFGRDPSPAEICAALGITPDQIDTVRQDASALSIRSMSEPLNDEDSITLGDTVADPSDQMGDVLDRIQNEQLARILWRMVDELEKVESDAIKGKYIDGMQYSEIAQHLGLKDPGQARNITVKALHKLRNSKDLKKLKAFYEEYISLSYQCTGLNYFKHTHTSSPERAAIILIDSRCRDIQKFAPRLPQKTEKSQ